jgi:hypothetical protein
LNELRPFFGNMRFIRAQSKLWLMFCMVTAIESQLLAQVGNGSRQVGTEPPANLTVEFDRDIFPILQSRCLECHSEQSKEGDLRLDDEQQAKQGGHTGRQLLSSPAEESELYQRLISTDPTYRMPKKADPLTAAEISLIKTWLDQGAKWGSRSQLPVTGDLPGVGNPVLPESKRSAWEALVGEVQVFFENSSRPRYRLLSNLTWFAVGWLLWLVFTILYKSKKFWRDRKRPGTAGSLDNADPQIRSSPLEWLCERLLLWRWLLGGLLLIFASTAFLYQAGTIEELRAALRQSESSVRRQPTLRITEDRRNLVLPVNPDHPPRLGGTYYRGNDERDPALFNGGVYRTATMELSLVNQEKHRLEWNAIVEKEPWSINLLLQRAPRTTAPLFSELVFQETHLRRFRETELVTGNGDDESGKIRFTVVDPEQTWIARIPLEPSSDWKDGRNAGVIYVAYGAQEVDGYQGRVHYGIRYDLRIKDGVLSPESVLWMGAIYDLGGRVLIPRDNEILLHQWFDYRPLPIIEIDNPDDPELLGLPEHLGKDE